MGELLRDIMKTLGLRADEMAGMKIFSNGDLYTVLKERQSFPNMSSDLRSAIECQDGSCARASQSY